MLHFKYKIKGMLKTKVFLFWSLVFPLLLGTAFYFMFGNINTSFRFETIQLGVVNGETDDSLRKLLDTLETDQGKAMFEITEFDSMADAGSALESGTVSCYVAGKENPELYVQKSSVSNSIVKAVITQYKENSGLIEEILEDSPEKINDFLQAFTKEDSVILENVPLKGRDKNSFTQYFYALLAMTCLMASMGGVQDGMRIQPTLSPLAARRNVSPTGKMVQFLTDFLASFFLYCILTTVVLAVCVFVYKQDFGDNVFLVLLATWTGSFTGMVIGDLIALFIPGSTQLKDSLCVAFFMISSFLGGLQWGDITYYIEKSCPVINRINPATLIVNSYRSLTLFGDYKAYAVNLITLFGIGLACIILCTVKLRRKKYASI